MHVFVRTFVIPLQILSQAAMRQEPSPLLYC